MFMVCFNVKHVWDDQPPMLHNDHCRLTDMFVAEPGSLVRSGLADIARRLDGHLAPREESSRAVRVAERPGAPSKSVSHLL
jgi:hypothetical protein